MPSPPLNLSRLRMEMDQSIDDERQAAEEAPGPLAENETSGRNCTGLSRVLNASRWDRRSELEIGTGARETCFKNQGMASEAT